MAASRASTRVRKRYVILIERAYRGLVEEQYANILWLSESIAHMGCEVTVILQGYAVYHAIAADDHRGKLVLAGVALEAVGDYRQALAAASSKGLRIMANAADWDQLAAPDARLCESVQLVHRADIGALVEGADQVWFW